MRKFSNIKVKFKLFIPISLGIILAILVITFQSIQNSKKSIYKTLEQSLYLEIETITKMFEREHDLKNEQVKSNLNVINHLFYNKKLQISKKDSIELEAKNQITENKFKLKVPIWKWSNLILHNSNKIVDSLKRIVGGTATIFQKIDSGYIRISTNVMDENRQRAIGTFIPNNSPVVKAIEKGETYYGRAYVVNDWYITAYEPIVISEKTVGMLYVGDKEKNLQKLKNILKDIKIGKSGKLIVLDEKNNIILQTENNYEIKTEFIIKNIIEKNDSIIHTNDYIITRKYYPDFKLNIISAINKRTETSDLIKQIIIYSVFIGLIIIIILLLFVFLLTNESLHNYLKQVELSAKKLETTREVLAQTEKQFRHLFDNSSDEIFVSDLRGKFLEVNNVACESLGYSKGEFLNMRFSDIKSDKYRALVQENIKKIIAKRKFTYETEHVTKNGEVIAVEMKSRLINYNNEDVIMSISRNINKRKAIEKKILSTIIETESKERKRFAADLHDGLGPILSTIKLYTDLLKKADHKKTSKEELVENIDELVEMAISTSKEISNNITPAILDDFGLAVAIQEFTNYLKKTKSIDIVVNTDKYTCKRRGLFETILYQAIKELINNTLKHSGASKIIIQLKSYQNQIILYYKDNGHGFDVEKAQKETGGLGLNNIINKIRTIKGSCDFYSEKESGMFVLINLKLDENNSKKQ